MFTNSYVNNLVIKACRVLPLLYSENSYKYSSCFERLFHSVLPLPPILCNPIGGIENTTVLMADRLPERDLVIFRKFSTFRPYTRDYFVSEHTNKTVTVLHPVSIPCGNKYFSYVFYETYS